MTRPARGKIRAHQSGWLKRLPIRFIGNKESAELAGYLNGFPNLQQTLSELDYRRFSLTFDDSGWRCGIEPGPPAKWSVNAAAAPLSAAGSPAADAAAQRAGDD